MIATYVCLTILTLAAAGNWWALIRLRRRVTRAEINLDVLRTHCSRLERDMRILWVSANHQLPPHIRRIVGR
jgi:hypothetical protein